MKRKSMDGSTSRKLFALMLAFVGGLAAEAEVARRPINDDFSDRIPVLGTRVTVTGNNADATLEPGEPSGATVNGFPTLKTVWWTWTAPADGALALSALGSDFDAVLKVYTGTSVTNLAPVPNGQSGAPDTGRLPAFMSVVAGASYQIAVGSWSGNTGKIVLDLAFMPRATNDDFAHRIPLGSGNARANGTTLGATVEAQEPFYYDNAARGSMWWSWTASASGLVIFQVAAATPVPGDWAFGQRGGFVGLNVFTGDELAGLILVTNSMGGNGVSLPLCQMRLEAVEGTTYQLSVEGAPGFLDQFELTVARTSPPEVILTQPANAAEFIAGAPVVVAAEAVDSDGSVTKREFFAVGWPENILRQAWDTARPFRAVLTNLPPATYELIARATDDLGVKSDSIPVEFNVRPANDAFARRTLITGAFVTVTGTLANASVEIDEPPAAGQRSVWWEWMAPTAGIYTLTATTDFAEAGLAVFTGTSLPALSPVANLSGRSERIVFQAVAGKSYMIAVSSFGSIGQCMVQVAQTAPPSVTLLSPTNDMRAIEGTTVKFSAQATDPDGNIAKVEFFDVFSTSLGSVSNAPFTLTRTIPLGYYGVYAVATDNQGVTTRSQEVTLRVVPVPPGNDDFTNRIPFTGSFLTVTGDTANATFEPGDQFGGSDGSVWWEWTAPEAGDYSITVASTTGFWPWIAVYTGAEMDSLTLVTNGLFYGYDNTYSALVTIHATAGERYQFAAGSRAVVWINVAPTLPPIVRMTSPTNNTVFLLGETVDVRAEASDPDETIQRVEFYLDGALFMTLTNAPFAFSFPLNDLRYHSFQARAFGNYGVATITEPVSFRTREPGPVNDAFADRIAFTGSFLSVTGSASNATVEPGEGYWDQNGSAWWEWTAPQSGTFTIEVRDDLNYRPTLAVFTGGDLAGLELVARDDRRVIGSGNSARVVIEAEAGVTYPIAVQAYGPVVLTVARTKPPTVRVSQPSAYSVLREGDAVVLQADATDSDGTIRSIDFILDGRLFATLTNEPFVLQTTFREGNTGHILQVRATDRDGVSTFSDYVYFEVSNRPPINDNFAERSPLHGWFVVLEAADWSATREPGEPSLNEGLGSVWWRWTAPASGRVTLTCDRPYANLAVCLGTNVEELEVIATASPSIFQGIQLVFDAVGGTEYAIVFQPRESNYGRFRLSLLLDARELSGLRMSSRGRLALDLYTTLDRAWVIEATTNLVDWSPVATSPVSNGLIRFLDPPVPGRQQRFFRAVAAP